jgi:hypothetical protein
MPEVVLGLNAQRRTEGVWRRVRSMCAGIQVSIFRAIDVARRYCSGVTPQAMRAVIAGDDGHAPVSERLRGRRRAALRRQGMEPIGAAALRLREPGRENHARLQVLRESAGRRAAGSARPRAMALRPVPVHRRLSAAWT